MSTLTYIHKPVKYDAFCPPKEDHLAITKWPTQPEYDAIMSLATSIFASLTVKLANDFLKGIQTSCDTLGQAKKAWLWLYALDEFNPLLFEGNVLTAPDFWAIANQVYDMRQACSSGGGSGVPNIPTVPSVVIVYAGPDQVQSNVTQVTLTGSLTIPTGVTIVSQVWSMVSGPNTPTITSPASLTTTVTGMTNGVYVFRLTTVDSYNRTATDTVQVTITAPPGAIVVNAGPDQNLPPTTESTTITATLTIPPGTIAVNHNWTCISNPPGGAPALATANSLSTLVSSLASGPMLPGTYIMKMTVQDNFARTTSDTMNIIIGNLPDTIIVNAGPDQELPTGQTTSSVTATLTIPAGVTVVSQVWTQEP